VRLKAKCSPELIFGISMKRSISSHDNVKIRMERKHTIPAYENNGELFSAPGFSWPMAITVLIYSFQKSQLISDVISREECDFKTSNRHLSQNLDSLPLRPNMTAEQSPATLLSTVADILSDITEAFRS
jgi:hypothetical protein